MQLILHVLTINPWDHMIIFLVTLWIYWSQIICCPCLHMHVSFYDCFSANRKRSKFGHWWKRQHQPRSSYWLWWHAAPQCCHIPVHLVRRRVCCTWSSHDVACTTHQSWGDQHWGTHQYQGAKAIQEKGIGKSEWHDLSSLHKMDVFSQSTIVFKAAGLCLIDWMKIASFNGWGKVALPGQYQSTCTAQ